MMDMQVYFASLGLILAIGVAAWLVSVAIRNVAFVDSLWSLFFLVAALSFATATDLLSVPAVYVGYRTGRHLGYPAQRPHHRQELG